MENKIEIPLSKLKISLLFLGTITLLVLGVLFTLNPEEWLSSGSKSPGFIRVSGIVATLFFGICVVFIGRKLFDNTIGLTLNDQGIIDNTNGTSIGLIEWGDITSVKRIEIAHTNILLIMTDKPEKYIAKATNGFAKQAMKANHKMYGSPLSIISSSLQINFDELEDLIHSAWHQKKKSSGGAIPGTT